MTTTALRAALARIDWAAVGRRTIAGLQLCWLVAQLLAAALVVAIAWIREHRAELRAALVATIAAVIVAAQLTHAAGRTTRRWLEQLNARAADLVHSQPLPPAAAITAPLQALREALERWVTRLYRLSAGRSAASVHGHSWPTSAASPEAPAPAAGGPTSGDRTQRNAAAGSCLRR